MAEADIVMVLAVVLIAMMVAPLDTPVPVRNCPTASVAGKLATVVMVGLPVVMIPDKVTEVGARVMTFVLDVAEGTPVTLVM